MSLIKSPSQAHADALSFVGVTISINHVLVTFLLLGQTPRLRQLTKKAFNLGLTIPEG